MTQKHIELIALDIDNTLLNSEHKILPKTKAALRQAAAQGIKVVLATGKTRASSGEIKEQLDLNTPGVYLQGLVLTAADGSVTEKTLLPDALAREALELAGELGYPFTAYHDTDVYALERSKYTEWVVQFQEPAPQVFDSLDILLSQKPIQKIIFCREPEKLDSLRPILEERFNGRATLVRSQTWALEIIPLGTSKGAGLQTVLDNMGIDPAHMIAFGDGENDLEMIQMAGIGVAMENGMPRLKEHADYITHTNNDEGIAHALSHFGIVSGL